MNTKECEEIQEIIDLYKNYKRLDAEKKSYIQGLIRGLCIKNKKKEFR